MFFIEYTCVWIYPDISARGFKLGALTNVIIVYMVANPAINMQGSTTHLIITYVVMQVNVITDLQKPMK